MSQTTVKAWKCDRESCGHVWYTGSDEPPKSCSKCKSKNWNTETIAPLIKSGAVKTANHVCPRQDSKKVFGPSRIEACLPQLRALDAISPYVRPAHAPGCKCLMCQGK